MHLKSFNNITDIILFLIHKLLFSLIRFYLQCHFWTKFVTSVIFYCSIPFIAMSIMNGNCNFSSNNVKGIKASGKWLRLFEYLRNSINNNGFILIQETHSPRNDKGVPLFCFIRKVILVLWQSTIVEQKLLKW